MVSIKTILICLLLVATLSFYKGFTTLSFAQGCQTGSGCVVGFTDISKSLYKDAINYVQKKGIVQGYPNGTYKPDQVINRAEFIKILLSATEAVPRDSQADCFKDVDHTKWFAKFICRAKAEKIISGYSDGSFKPEKNVSFVEAAKILINGFKVTNITTPSENIWYESFAQTMADKKAIPGTIQKKEYLITRGEMAEMVMRLKESITTKPSLTACDFIPLQCSDGSFSGYGDAFQPHVDIAKIRVAWLGWYNEARKKNKLTVYSYNNDLNRTAYIWSAVAKTKGLIEHKRPGTKVYYDYNAIQQWFRDLGVIFKNISNTTFTENIGWGPYRCSTDNCTQVLIDSIRSTFDFYMAEKGKKSAPHYNSVMNKYFKVIGLGISLDEQAKKYYLTVHYAVEPQNL